MNEKICEFIDSHKDEMVRDLAELVAIPSVSGEPERGAPFGEEPRRALYKMKELCERMGFVTAVYGEAVLCASYGESPELGILAHLDVVPASAENWDTDPFTLTDKDGVLFGRGAIDDKGPAVAALWALNAVKSLGIPLKKGVRLIFGTDEENGSKDLEIYKEYAKFPPKVFTPDGAFPVINVEKGMLGVRFSGNTGGNYMEFRGGNIPNAVADKAKTIMRKVSADKVRASIPEDSPAKFTVTERGDNVFISCDGTAAHASTPENGVNAVTALLSLMNRVTDEPGLRGIEKLFPFGQTDGTALGLKCADESGALTCVLSTLAIMPSGECEGTVDIRFPTCVDLQTVKDKVCSVLESHRLKCEIVIGNEPHVVPEDSDFVGQLLSVYESVEGEKGRCIAIGGGTYVHNIDGGVAFGAERSDTDYHMHGANEFITTDELCKDAVLYAHAIAEVCK
ncbi:MAG: Sapep family Mn(2+)-dependent dipeptidase [Oscillospiraceae bacterium]|nr:Sapep family Mn(2+)-dependent dipeptidase [Oscillospiraceae bacterium]